MRFFAASPIDNADLSQPLDAAAHPAEAAFFIRVRIENPRHLSRRRKEILVNEGVVIRKKNAESWMRMIPAHNPLRWILLILHRIDVLPGVLRESDVSAGLFGILPLDAGRDVDAVIAILADEHTADFGFAAGARMLPDLADHLAIDHQSRLYVRRFCLGLHDFNVV